MMTNGQPLPSPPPKAAGISDQTQFVTIGVADEIIAIAVSQVQEVLDVQPFVRIPNMPPVVRGMIDVRKQAIPVYDLRQKFALPQIDTTPQSRIVILDVDKAGQGKQRIGVLTDRVFEVTALDSTDVDPPPDFGFSTRSPAVVGLGRRNGSLVVILDVGRLFEDDPLTRTALAEEVN